MAQFISVDYPEYLANVMRLNKDEFEREIKILGLVKLFELGKVSSGTAAKVLQMSRLEFLELLARYQVSFLEVESIEDDLQQA
jgi:predicted HTH domain antitoxin